MLQLAEYARGKDFDAIAAVICGFWPDGDALCALLIDTVALASAAVLAVGGQAGGG